MNWPKFWKSTVTVLEFVSAILTAWTSVAGFMRPDVLPAIIWRVPREVFVRWAAAALVLILARYTIRNYCKKLGGYGRPISALSLLRLANPVRTYKTVVAMNRIQEELIRVSEDQHIHRHLSDPQYAERIVKPLLREMKRTVDELFCTNVIVDLKLFSSHPTRGGFQGVYSNPRQHYLHSLVSVCYGYNSRGLTEQDHAILEHSTYKIVTGQTIEDLQLKHPVADPNHDFCVNSAFNAVLKLNCGCWIGNQLDRDDVFGKDFYTNSPNFKKHYRNLGVFLVARAQVIDGELLTFPGDNAGLESTVLGLLVIKSNDRGKFDAAVFRELGKHYANRLYHFIRKATSSTTVTGDGTGSLFGRE